MKNWKIPILILAILTIAMIFRWSDITAITPTGNDVKLLHDNWNGQAISWQLTGKATNSNLYQYEKNIVLKPFFDSDTLTVIWVILTAAGVIWLIYCIIEFDKEKKKLNNS